MVLLVGRAQWSERHLAFARIWVHCVSVEGAGIEACWVWCFRVCDQSTSMAAMLSYEYCCIQLVRIVAVRQESVLASRGIDESFSWHVFVRSHQS